MTRVSAIVTAHNEEAFIGAAIDSALSQDVPPHEIIVVNDASLDGTQAVIDAMMVEHPGVIRCVTLPHNRGAPFSRNAGAALANGEMLAFLDGDDLWFPHKLASQCAILDRHPEVGYTYGSAISLHAGCANATAERIGSSSGVYQPPELCVGYLRDAYWNFWPSGLLIRRSTFQSSGGFVEALGAFQHWEDYFYACQLGLTELAYVTEEPLTYYRVHEDSCSRRAELTRKTIVDERVGLEWFVSHLRSRGPWPVAPEIVAALERRLGRNERDFAEAVRTRPGLSAYGSFYTTGSLERLRTELGSLLEKS